MKALEKAEAKLKQKLEKRNARSLYEGSKLMEAQNNKKSYEELFLEVNPLNALGTGKGKSKDIHIEQIDVHVPVPLRVIHDVLLEADYACAAQLWFEPHLVQRHPHLALRSVRTQLAFVFGSHRVTQTL